MARPLSDPVAGELPQRAVDLLVAREVLRLGHWHRRACAARASWHPFRDLAHLLEAGRPSREELAAMAGRFRAIYEKLEGGGRRSAAVTAAGLCEAQSWTGWIYRPTQPGHDVWWLTKRELREDDRRWSGATEIDRRALRAMSRAKLEAATCRSLGPLWGRGAPGWLSAKWPRPVEFRRRSARIRGDDRPPWRVRAAPLLRVSRRLPESILETLDAGPFELEYVRVASIRVIRAEDPDTHCLPIVTPLKDGDRMAVAARHRFRRGARPALLSEFARFARVEPRLRALLAFYREHDGALLFAPRDEPTLPPIELVGLAAQRRAREVLLYDVQSWALDDPERVPAFLAGLGVVGDHLHVLALAGLHTLVIPMRGRKAGRVFRVTKSGRASGFAPDAESALRLMTRQAVSRAGEREVPEADTDPEWERASLFRLRRVRTIRPGF